MRLVAPDVKEHRPLEHELPFVSRLRESVEQPLDAVPGEQSIELDTSPLRQIQEPLLDRRGDIRRSGHARASRYGRITLLARAISAAFQISSTVPAAPRR